MSSLWTPSITPMAIFFVLCLVVQSGMLPVMTKAYLPPDMDFEVFVFLGETLKISLSFLLLTVLAEWEVALKNWEWRECVESSGVPALLYAVGNILNQIGYTRTDPLVASLMLQVKIVWTALFLYLICSVKQSGAQMLAFAGIILGSIILTSGEYLSGGKVPPKLGHTREVGPFFDPIGPLCFLCSGVLSGLATAYTQRVLTGKGKRNSLLYSAELAVTSMFFLVIFRLYRVGLTTQVSRYLTIPESVTIEIIVPVFLFAVGGIIVGQVTRTVGGLWKGFALIGGIWLTAYLRTWFESTPLTGAHIIAFPIIVFSSYVHMSSPLKKDIK